MSASPNPIVWFEIYVDDMVRAKGFYEVVFEVVLEMLPPVDGSIEMWTFPANMDKPGVSGALCKMEGCSGGGGGTMVYFGCKDCAVEESRVEAAGGKVIKAKFPIGMYGFISIVADTEGNTIGLHSME